MVRMKLVKTTSVPSLSTVTAKAELVQGQILDGPILLEQAPELSKGGTGVQLSSSLVAPGEELVVVLQNSTGFTQQLKQGTLISLASEAQPVEEQEIKTLSTTSLETASSVCVRRVQSTQERKKQLAKLFAEEGQNLKWQDRDKLYSLLFNHHSAIALENGERGETGLVQMEILTGDAPPKRLPVRRIPSAVRGEVAKQLKEMQGQGVIMGFFSTCTQCCY